MNCKDIQSRLNAYLDDELSPSERKLIQLHLSSCAVCQHQLESLKTLQNQLRWQMKTLAAAAAPSKNAWSLVQGQLQRQAKTMVASTTHSTRAWSLVKASLLSALHRIRTAFRIPNIYLPGRLSPGKVALVVLVLLVLVVSAPIVWAKVEPWVGTWLSFESPDGENFSAIGGFTAFTPYHAAYLPDGFDHSGTGTITGWPDYEAVELTYDNHRNAQFFTFLESVGGERVEMPDGEPVRVASRSAVFVAGFASSADELVAKKPGLSIVTNFDYRSTNMLAWTIDEVRVEMFSNLSKDEMLKIAASLEPMRVTEGESPPAP